MSELRDLFQLYVHTNALEDAELLLSDWANEQKSAFEPQFHRIQLLILQGQIRQAVMQAEKLAHKSKCPDFLFEPMVQCLSRFALHDALIAFVQANHLNGQIAADALSDAAIMLTRIAAYPLAFQLAALAVKRAPKDLVCLVNHAIVQNFMGETAKAKETLSRLVSNSERLPMAYWLLSRMDSHDNQLVAKIESVLMREARASKTDHQAIAYLNYALFNCLDRLQLFDAAWQALLRAGQAMNALVPYDAIATEKQIQSIKRSFANTFGAKFKPAARPNTVPIFIVGLHRSGTSLVERILGQSKQVHDFGESQRLHAAIQWMLNSFESEISYAKLETTEPLDFDALANHFNGLASKQSGGKKFATEKTPHNFLHVGFMAEAMPYAKVIHLRRQPMDVCFANIKEMFGPEIKHTHSIREISHYYGQYRELMDFWHQRYPGYVLDVDYENLVAEPQIQSKRIFDYCGIEWNDSFLAIEKSAKPVSTLSAAQVRRPINTASVGKNNSYAPWLADLRNGLAPYLTQ